MKGRSFSLFDNAIKSEETRSIYNYSLSEFMRFAKIKNYDDIPKLKTNKIQTLLENWVMHLSDKGLKAQSIRGKIHAVELFLEMNKMIFYKRVLHKLIPSDDYIAGGEKPFTTEEIQKMLAASAKLRTKAIIHFLASTGIRPAGITDPVLRLKHIEDVPHLCKAIKIYDGSREGYWAFLTPEASKAMNAYFVSRRLNKENLTPESPVFANFSKNTVGKKNDYMSSKALRQMMYNVLKAAGIERRKEGNRYDKAVVYGFRKRFNTILKVNNDVNSNIAEKLMAHKRGLDASYLKPTKEQCFAEFAKAIPELIIDPTERQKVIIKKQNEEITDLQIKDERISNLEKNQEELKGLINVHETIKMFKDPKYRKSIKYLDVNGKEIPENEDGPDRYRWLDNSVDFMHKELESKLEKYKIKHWK